MVIQIQFNPSGYKFANYGNWTKSWDLLQFDWLRYMAWNYQSSKTKESSIEIQLFNQTIQTLSKAIQHNIKSLDKLKVLELLRDHKFMDQIFKNSLILKEFQLELIQDLDQLLLLVRFKSPCNMNMQDSLSFQLIKAY
jgi:hypothetical protein